MVFLRDWSHAQSGHKPDHINKDTTIHNGEHRDGIVSSFDDDRSECN